MNLRVKCPQCKTILGLGGGFHLYVIDESTAECPVCDNKQPIMWWKKQSEIQASWKVQTWAAAVASIQVMVGAEYDALV